MVDYYNLLGISKGASAQEIRSAYRKLAREVHPDAHPLIKGDEMEALKRRFIQLTQAYEVLSDPAKKAEHDQKAFQGDQFGFTGKPGFAGGTSNYGTSSHRERTARQEGRKKATGPPPDETEGPTLDELLGDAESLLGQFGLDMRLPFEAMLEELLQWALEVYRAVLDAWEQGDSPQGATGATTRDDTRQHNRDGGTSKSGGRSASRAQDRAEERDKRDKVEAELAEIKKKLRKKD